MRQVFGRFTLGAVLLSLVAATAAANGPELGLQNVGGPQPTAKITSCGNAYYDDGDPEGVFWLGGGQATNSENMFAVQFLLSDFGYAPGEAAITGFCVGNDLIVDTGAATNHIYVYGESGGLPDPGQLLGDGFVTTGDGSGQVEVMFPAPVALNGNFWIVNRGDMSLPTGTNFSAQADSDTMAGHSYFSNSGIAGLQPLFFSGQFHDLIFRATLVPVGGQTCNDSGMGCVDGLNCQFPPTLGFCGTTGLSGTCGDPNGICTFILQPVCGCDGMTYSNDCVRLRSGAKLAHEGECVGGGPDLVANEIGAACQADGSLFVTVSDCNLGSQSAGPHDVGLYLAHGQVVTFDDIRFGHFRSSQSMSPDSCVTLQGSVLITGTTGTFGIGAIADDQFEVTETNENNNGVLGNEVTLPCATGAPPTADFGWQPSNPGPGQRVQFEDLSTGDPTQRSWDFGDGGSSSDTNPVHIYNEPGTYSVRLTVNNQWGGSTRTKSLTVPEPEPTLDFRWSPQQPAPGQPVEFTLISSAGSASVVEWNFGAAGCSGSPERGSCVTSGDACSTWVHRFAASGSQNVSVIATIDGARFGPVVHPVSISGSGSCGDGEICGNAVCGDFESARTCPSDCQAVCGNAVCELTENPFACPADCQPVCGNGLCEAGETVTTCPNDCPLPPESTGLASSQCTQCYVPAVVGRVPGAGDTVWSGEAMLSNLREDPLVCWMVFTPDGPGTKTSMESGRVPLDGGETLYFENLIQDVFGVTSGGNVRVYSDAPLTVTSRIYNTGDAGTYGQLVEAHDGKALLSPGEVGFVTGLEEDSDYRTNLFLQEASGVSAVVRVQVHDADGDVVRVAAVPLEPDQTERLSLASDFGLANLEDAYVTVEVVEGGQVDGLGSVIDNTTGDAITIDLFKPKQLPPFGKTNAQVHTLVPVVARANGFGGTVWRTRLVTQSLGDAQTVQLRLYPSTGGAPITGQITIGPGDLKVDRDVVETLAGNAQITGSLHMFSDGPILVDSVTRNTGGAGTFGDGLPGLGAGDLLAQSEHGFIELLESNDTFRSNVGFTEFDGIDTVVQVTLYQVLGNAAIPLATRQYTVPAFRNLQVNRIFNAMGIVKADAAKAKITVLSGGKIYAYASKVDNATGDATNLVVVPVR
jgi:PKD repeat protein